MAAMENLFTFDNEDDNEKIRSYGSDGENQYGSRGENQVIWQRR